MIKKGESIKNSYCVCVHVNFFISLNAQWQLMALRAQSAHSHKISDVLRENPSSCPITYEGEKSMCLDSL